MGRDEDEGAGLFSALTRDRHKLKYVKVHLNTGSHFFTVRVGQTLEWAAQGYVQTHTSTLFAILISLLIKGTKS